MFTRKRNRPPRLITFPALASSHRATGGFLSRVRWGKCTCGKRTMITKRWYCAACYRRDLADINGEQYYPKGTY